MSTIARLSLLFLLGVTVVAQTAPEPVWTVRLIDHPETAFRVTSSNGRIEFRDATAVAFTIPPSSITEVLHATRRSHLRAYTPRAKRPCCSDEDPSADRALDVSALLSAVAAPPPTYGKGGHYVRITWNDNGERDALLDVPGEDSVRFLEWLDKLSGTGHRDLDRERDDALKQIEQRKGEAFRVVLKYPARHDGPPLIVDSWVVPIEIYAGTGLFFFHSEVKPKNLFWILPVIRQQSKNECVHDVEVEYGRCDPDVCDVRAVLLPTVTYRPQTARERIEDLVVSDCERLKNQQHSEEKIPALRQRPEKNK